MNATLPRVLGRGIPISLALLAISFGLLTGSMLCVLPGLGLLSLQAALLVIDDDDNDDD